VHGVEAAVRSGFLRRESLGSDPPDDIGGLTGIACDEHLVVGLGTRETRAVGVERTAR
jgi:hypothetical protein